LRAALDWAFSPHGDVSVGVALTAASVPLWMHSSLLDECRTRVGQALAAVEAQEQVDARCEMKLHAALGASLAHTGAATAAETGAAWTNVLAIAESLDDAEYQLRSLRGLWLFHHAAARHNVALELAHKFYILATNRSDWNHRLVAERLIGVLQHHLGEQPSARRHIERVLANNITSNHLPDIVRFPLDQRMAARVILARILWLQGFPDQAMRAPEGSLADARAANHPLSLCYALAVGACPIALLVGDLAAAEHYSGILLDHSTKHALARWGALGRGHQGALAIKCGDVATGLPLLRAGLDELGEGRVAWRLATFLDVMVAGEALGRAGQIGDGLVLVEEVIDHSERTEERWAFAELLRIKAELLLLQGAVGATAAAEDHFRQALDWARRQGARSWELRAAMSLARLWRDQNRSTEAVALLAPIYNRFTEGFETADLKTAKALIDSLPLRAGARRDEVALTRLNSHPINADGYRIG
jgi:predicted ATPase